MSAGTNYVKTDWKGAQAIANFYRRKGTKVHVCTLEDNLFALWYA